MNLYTTFLGQEHPGTPLLILHGLFGNQSNWAGFAKQVSASRPVILMDLLNHGQSPHTDAFSYKAQAHAVAETLSSFGITSVIVLGHSMGGKVAMQLAHDYPTLLTQLIVVDIAPKQYPDWHRHIFDALLAVPLNSIQTRQDADKVLEDAGLDLIRRLFLLKNLKQQEGNWAWAIHLQGLAKQYHYIAEPPSLLNPIKAPTLWVSGANSDYLEASDQPALLRQFPNSEFVEIEGAGHWVHAEKPKRFFEVVSGFFA